MSVSHKTKLLLAYRSGAICAMPNCRRWLTCDNEPGKPVNIGEAAHIAGARDGSARFEPDMTDDERNSYSNLIYLCCACHKMIDAIEKNYPASRLRKIKTDHEEKVRQAILDKFSEIRFEELQEVTEWITKIQPSNISSDYSLRKIEDKIRLNDLGNNRFVIAMGLGVCNEVSKYIKSVALTDPDFPERLKTGFLSEYLKLKKEGFKGDELFELMCQFATQGFHKEPLRSAALAVLIYLFETCEVFEK